MEDLLPQRLRFYQGREFHHLARVYGKRKQNYAGQSFWARRVTVGRDETVIRE